MAWAEAYLRTKWHLNPPSRFATTDMGRKVGEGAVPLGVELGPHLTLLPGPRPTVIPSGMLIRPAVWPQQTWAKNGSCALFWGGEMGPHLTECPLDQGLPP